MRKLIQKLCGRILGHWMIYGYDMDDHYWNKCLVCGKTEKHSWN